MSLCVCAQTLFIWSCDHRRIDPKPNHRRPCTLELGLLLHDTQYNIFIN